MAREEIALTALLALLAQENLLLVGPLGTGKSMIARRISQILAPQPGSADYFEYLLTKFSTPEELFGPLSIQALKQDRFERQTAGYLPSVKVAFLDEIFKASSSILNSLLTLLNERKFHNGSRSEATPLQAIVAASNELPKGQPELAALYDRFLLRRFVKTLYLLQISAASNGRQEADLSDLVLLKDCLWNNDENRKTVQKLIIDVLQRHDQEIDAEDGGEVPAKPQAAAKPGNKIKGYRGSGSEADPILIETRDQLLGLAREDVGAQGYYFRQTADIDCSDLSTWNPIPLFCGHYDGGDFSINYQENSAQWLFSTISNSRLSHMHLGHFSLAEKIEDSTIEDCYMGKSLANRLSNSKVHRCTSELFLVLDTAEHSAISDCVVQMTITTNDADDDDESFYLKCGGIAENLTNSQVQRCYVAGDVYSCAPFHLYLNGIAWRADNSTINHCAIGPIKRLHSDVVWESAIVAETQGSTTLEHNVVIDSNEQKGSDPNGDNGLAIAAAQWNAYYFEYTLGWDFDTVWEWDDATGSPVLRDYQSGSRPSTAQELAAGKQSLLLAQMRQNIWLNQHEA